MIRQSTNYNNESSAHLPTFYRPLLRNVHELHLFLVNFLHMSQFNIEITYLLTDYSAMDSSTTARCVLIMRKFGTPAVLKFRYTYKNKNALRGYVMRYVMTR